MRIRVRDYTKLIAITASAWLLTVGFTFTRVATAAETDTCVDCHENADFLVTNKKLYDYFQQWTRSIHREEEVSCSDCHGGDPTAAAKEEAHGKGVGADDPSSGIYYQNVPDTCGECHSEILEAFQKSGHYEHVRKKGQEKQGPTCVTCHGSIDVGVLDVNTVERACARCHNEKTDNHPQNPAKAKNILNKFLSIHHFYRYITVRLDRSDADAFFADVNAKQEQLAVTWHSFDLKKIVENTDALLDVLRAKRSELRAKESTGKK